MDTVTIDGKDIKLKATGTTPVIFQEVFGVDLLLELNGKGLSESVAEQSTVTYRLHQLTYVMNRQAEGADFRTIINDGKEAYMNWLDEFSWGGLTKVAMEALSVFNGDAQPTAELKKTPTSQES